MPDSEWWRTSNRIHEYSVTATRQQWRTIAQEQQIAFMSKALTATRHKWTRFYEYLLQYVKFTIKTGHDIFSQSVRIMIQMKPPQRGIATWLWLDSERSQFSDVTSRKTKAQRQEKRGEMYPSSSNNARRVKKSSVSKVAYDGIPFTTSTARRHDRINADSFYGTMQKD